MTQTFKKVALFAVLTGVANVVVAEPTAAEKAQALFKQYVNLHTKEGLGVNAVAVVLNTLAHGHFNPAGGEYGKSLKEDYWTNVSFRAMVQEADLKAIAAELEKKEETYTAVDPVDNSAKRKAAVEAATAKDDYVAVDEVKPVSKKQAKEAAIKAAREAAEAAAKLDATCPAEDKAEARAKFVAEFVEANEEVKAATAKEEEKYAEVKEVLPMTKEEVKKAAIAKAEADNADVKGQTKAEVKAAAVKALREAAAKNAVARTAKQKLQALSSLVTEALIVTSAVNSVLATMAQDAAEDVEEADADVEAAVAA